MYKEEAYKIERDKFQDLHLSARIPEVEGQGGHRRQGRGEEGGRQGEEGQGRRERDRTHHHAERRRHQHQGVRRVIQACHQQLEGAGLPRGVDHPRGAGGGEQSGGGQEGEPEGHLLHHWRVQGRPLHIRLRGVRV